MSSLKDRIMESGAVERVMTQTERIPQGPEDGLGNVVQHAIAGMRRQSQWRRASLDEQRAMAYESIAAQASRAAMQAAAELEAARAEVKAEKNRKKRHEPDLFEQIEREANEEYDDAEALLDTLGNADQETIEELVADADAGRLRLSPAQREELDELLGWAREDEAEAQAILSEADRANEEWYASVAADEGVDYTEDEADEDDSEGESWA